MVSPQVSGMQIPESHSRALQVSGSTNGCSFRKCNGMMGVPITFLDKYCPEQFEIIKFRHGDDGKDLCVNGKCPYFRILIRARGRKA